MNITNYLTECVQNNIPVSFSKYGDGEFNCIFNEKGHNCDRDIYSDKLSICLKKSFIYMVEKADNAYIGLWDNLNNKHILEKMVNKEVKWALYHTIIFDKKEDENKATLYKTIKESKLKKIIICNPLLIKSKLLLDIDEIIFIPFNSWFDTDFNCILNKVKEKIETDGNHIVITCCGMSAKVLICELVKSFPNGIYLDFGSALDIICTKRDSRGWNYGYEYFNSLLKDFLPENWEDDKYNEIYNTARVKLGLHLPK
jgi:hypothetical protein